MLRSKRAGTGIVPISHASSSHHDQRWPGQQLPDGMRALDGRELARHGKAVVALPAASNFFVCNGHRVTVMRR